MRPIDADALIDDCKKYLNSLNPSRDGKECTRIHWLIGILSNAHAIEPERKKGKWVKVPGYCTPGGDPVWCCSECGKGTHVYGIEHGTYGRDVADGQWVACPNCGVMMEGESL